MEKEISRILLDSGAINLSPEKPYRYASGILSPIYCDNRILISLPEMRKRIIGAFMEVIKKNSISFDIIAGTATAGIPHAAWLSDRYDVPMIYIRQKGKEHGKKNVIEGRLERNRKVLVIEDLISTGGSSVNAVKAVKASGAAAPYCLSIFTYEMRKAKNAFKEVKCKPLSLTNFSNLVSTACEDGHISENEMKTVLDWNKDPQNWGRKMGFE
jgi:orotate phosphoribosyltransferase